MTDSVHCFWLGHCHSVGPVALSWDVRAEVTEMEQQVLSFPLSSDACAALKESQLMMI